MPLRVFVLALFVFTAQSVMAQDKPSTGEAKWSSSSYFELTGRTGIIEKKRHSGGITTTRESMSNRLKLYAKYAWAEESGVKSEEEYIAGIDDEQDLSERTAWYGRVEYENDGIEDLHHRITVATGLGYYFLKEDRHKLRGRAGLFWRDEDYTRADNTRNVGIELGLYHQYYVREWGIWTTEIVYSPSLEDERQYQIKYESKLELPFKEIEGLSMEMGVYGLYNNHTPGPTEHYDTNYFVRIKYAW